MPSAKFAISSGFVYRKLPTTMDAAIGFLANRTAFAFEKSIFSDIFLETENNALLRYSMLSIPTKTEETSSNDTAHASCRCGCIMTGHLAMKDIEPIQHLQKLIKEEFIWQEQENVAQCLNTINAYALSENWLSFVTLSILLGHKHYLVRL